MARALDMIIARDMKEFRSRFGGEVRTIVGEDGMDMADRYRA